MFTESRFDLFVNGKGEATSTDRQDGGRTYRAAWYNSYVVVTVEIEYENWQAGQSPPKHPMPHGGKLIPQRRVFDRFGFS
jgi:hypothetical protein